MGEGCWAGSILLAGGIKKKAKEGVLSICPVFRLAERQLVKAREAETALLVKFLCLLLFKYFISNFSSQVERTRKANQFSATESTCRHTLASLMPTLLTQVKENLNTEAVTDLLRSKPGPEEKLKLWERLKV